MTFYELIKKFRHTNYGGSTSIIPIRKEIAIVEEVILFNHMINKYHGETSLQAVDFVSWAIFRKYEYGDDS